LKTGYGDFYEKEVISALMRKFKYKNVMQVPKLEKIVVNVGLGEAIQNIKALDAAAGDIALIAGQKPGRYVHWLYGYTAKRENV
jgi:large subunit ribosomal protein L5